ncbi:hypothetical protein Q31b_34010 [Novipirellula aureliae]|uniref:Uncharacterized protein n=1 Tax=Novipirellula aureliae TaxID=2527966 RepID=A0A5C6DVV7_9BACT|nr:hypothetical protein [Novipirellula aureliae]TWU40057.1 hypothetical protein Q31b_34010 [Novipirellula aureliae]
MRTNHILLIPLATIVMLTTVGCEEDENRRLADMSERHEKRQAEQNRDTAELHRKVVELQRDVQSERASIGQQRDRLESERHAIASQRRWDSLVAAAITNVGLLLACSLPLVLAWLLLARPPATGDEQALVEIMLDDLTAKQPLLLNRSDNISPRRLTDSAEVSDDSA